MTTDATITRNGPDANATHSTMRAISTVVGLGGIRSSAYSPSFAQPSVCWNDPKAIEAQRQIDRLNIAKKFADRRAEAADDVEGITTCMSMLSHFSVGPLPVPVASWTADSGASLFIQAEGFYGDLEIDGDTVEYLLKFRDAGEEIEVYNTEKVEEGRVPPQLLSHLFKAFVKYNAKVL